MYRNYQVLAKVKKTSTGKLLDSLPRNNVVAELCFGKLSVTYYRHPDWQSENYQHHYHTGILGDIS
jgi:hypothetical protein